MGSITRPSLNEWTYERNVGYGEHNLPTELWNVQLAVNDLEERYRDRRRLRSERYPIPPALYHYTDVNGLQGMMSTFNMWLSDAVFLNDPLEGSWVHHRAKALSREALGRTPLAEQILQQIEAQLSAPDMRLRSDSADASMFAAMENATQPAFIASFSENDDLLSQWRGYGDGGAGVSIGFDLNHLDFSSFEVIRDDRVIPKVIRVEYDVAVQDTEIRWIFTEARLLYDKYAESLLSYPSAIEYLKTRFLHPLREAMYWLRWEFKSPHYSEEKEWRIVVNPPGVFFKKTRVSNGRIIPS